MLHCRPLPDLPIVEVELSISNITKIGDPTFTQRLRIYSKYYGTFDGGDYSTEEGLSSPMSFSTVGLTSINPSRVVLKAFLEGFIRSGRDAFQLVLCLSQDSDGHSDDDYFVINPDNVKLYVTQ